MTLVDRSQAYTYRGDRWTAEALRGLRCFAVRALLPSKRPGQPPVCVRGKNGNMLVETDAGVRLVVLARQLRKVA